MAMSKNIEEIFSADKLRRNWGPEKAKEVSGEESSDDASPWEMMDDLRRVTAACFAGDDAEVLALCLAELEELLRRLFPEAAQSDAQSAPVTEERAKLLRSADDVICRLEDLADVFTLAGRMRNEP